MKTSKKPITIFWFRRDLRLNDNAGLAAALERAKKNGEWVLPLFIFDTGILKSLPPDDHRVNFIYSTLEVLDKTLKSYGSSLTIFKGKPENIFSQLLANYSHLHSKENTIKGVYVNEDYEPYARKRDESVKKILQNHNIVFHYFTDQVIFRPGEILKSDEKPYTIFTPFKNKWLSIFSTKKSLTYNSASKLKYLISQTIPFPSMTDLGISPSQIKLPPLKWSGKDIRHYDQVRDFPAMDGTSHVSVYLRFGLVSIRNLINHAWKTNLVYLSELIWREFFIHILWHFPKSAESNFKSQYNRVLWRNRREEFQLWCQGETGYPLVDAGMRELNQTGWMHNRVRMVVASFLCKHLLIDWRWGERYFAEKLFDFELASNSGNWQWGAGTGCDAAPYFRIFNPHEQVKKFDSKYEYIKKWISDFTPSSYPSIVNPIIEHKTARERALQAYQIRF